MINFIECSKCHMQITEVAMELHRKLNHTRKPVDEVEKKNEATGSKHLVTIIRGDGESVIVQIHLDDVRFLV